MRGFLIYLLFFPFVGFTQVNTPSWGIEDTIMVIDKTTDYGPVHDYLEIFNNAGQDLNMRWICLEPPSWPTLWITGFTDASQAYYTDVQHLDSADFILTNPPGWLNKMIIGVEHYSFAHTDTVRFKVFPLDFPQDSLILSYVIIIAQGNAWAGVEENSLDASYVYDGGSQVLSLNCPQEKIDLVIFDMNGKQVLAKQFHDGNSGRNVNLSTLQSGIYIIRVSSGNELVNWKISVT